MCLYFISIFNQIDFIFLSLNSKCIKKINVNFMIFFWFIMKQFIQNMNIFYYPAKLLESERGYKRQNKKFLITAN